MFGMTTDLISPQLVPAIVGSIIFAMIGFVLLVLAACAAYRIVDRLTPGTLGEQLVPVHGAPNVALAVVVGLMLLGMILGTAVVIAAAIH
jgi:hypothetical protein